MSNIEKSLRITAPLGVYHELHYPYRQLQKFWNKLVGGSDGRAAMVRFTQNQIRQCGEEKHDSARQYFLSRFMNLHEESSGAFTKAEVFQVCLTQITAGSDTTAISLRAILYYLFRYPSTLRTLRAEISDKIKDGELSEPIMYQQSLRIPYLQAVLKEAMRMHPAAGP
jgi:cytochrome P450